MSLKDKLARYSLKAQAERTRRQRGAEVINPAMAFADSRIVSGKDALALYLCLPAIHSGSVVPTPPHVNLLYASYNQAAASVAYVTLPLLPWHAC